MSTFCARGSGVSSWLYSKMARSYICSNPREEGVISAGASRRAVTGERMRRTLEMASSVFALASSSRGTALLFSRAQERERVSRGFSEGRARSARCACRSLPRLNPTSPYMAHPKAFCWLLSDPRASERPLRQTLSSLPSLHPSSQQRGRSKGQAMKGGGGRTVRSAELKLTAYTPSPRPAKTASSSKQSRTQRKDLATR